MDIFGKVERQNPDWFEAGIVELYKFKIVDSPLCAFCNSENESLEHLLFLCKASEVCWKEVLSWLAIHKNELLNVSLTDVLFGKFDIDKDFMVVNHDSTECSRLLNAYNLRHSAGSELEDQQSNGMTFSVRQLQEKCHEQRRLCTYIAFIDLTKAFDLVSWKCLFTRLRNIGCPRVITSFHEDMQGI